MSYLNLSKGIPNFTKAVISLWFRVPKESMQSISGVPLITFGKLQQQTTLTPNWVNLCGGTAVGDPYCPAVKNYTEGDQVERDPCSIYVVGKGDDDGVLAINLQTNGIATGTGINCYDKAATAPVPKDQEERNAWTALAHTPGSGWLFQLWELPGGNFKNNFVNASGINDLSDDVLKATPAVFFVKTIAPLSADQWHHLLLSFDLSSPIETSGPPVDVVAGKKTWDNVSEGTTSFAKMWYAIDDVDYRGRADEPGADGKPQYHMGPCSVDYDIDPTKPGPVGDPNGILTQEGWDVAKFGSAALTFGNQPLPVPDYSCSETTIEATKAELGIPASTKYVGRIYRVEMAEFQMWTDVILDTEKESNRRAFIDFERDENGEVIEGARLKPVNPKQAEMFMGKRQDVLLHGSNNWTRGYNTGSTGVDVELDDNGNEILTPKYDGQFEPIALIRPYKPEPSLKPDM